MAWTIDDGADAEAIHKYIQFAIKHNVRLTFFVYSEMSGWKQHAKLMQPLIDSGQIQIGNHSATHPDLTRLTSEEIKADLWKCHQFILKTYGIDARPYFRPPYGASNSTVIQAAAELGYTKPIIWSGTLADSSRIQSWGLLNFAKRYIGNQVILLAHANNQVASPLLKPILNIVRNHRLELVTLNDAMSPAPMPPTIVTATPSHGSASVTWSPVVNAHTYTVTLLPDNKQFIVRAPKRSIRFADLTNGKNYRFTVTATVFGVTSKPSKISAWIQPHATEPAPTDTSEPTHQSPM